MDEVYQKHVDADVETRWVPGHVGIEGNEVAKKAARGDSSPLNELPVALRNPLPLSVAATKQVYGDGAKKKAAALLRNPPRYPLLQKIDPSAPSSKFRKLTEHLTRQQASLLILLRTGHAPLNRHLHRIQKLNSPTGPACHRKDETVHHFIMECPAYARQRHARSSALPQDSHSLQKHLSHPKDMPHLMRYIAVTDRTSSTFDNVSPDEK